MFCFQILKPVEGWVLAHCLHLLLWRLMFLTWWRKQQFVFFLSPQIFQKSCVSQHRYDWRVLTGRLCEDILLCFLLSYFGFRLVSIQGHQSGFLEPLNRTVTLLMLLVNPLLRKRLLYLQPWFDYFVFKTKEPLKEGLLCYINVIQLICTSLPACTLWEDSSLRHEWM